MTTASLEDLLLKNVRRLPYEQQREVLHFAEALVRLQAAHRKGKSIVGNPGGAGLPHH